jgi:ubiquinone/menaquinone biosynthesis C-methylase UbiE
MVGQCKTDRYSISELGHASFLVPARKDQPELLDQNLGSPADVRSNLTEMWRLNRYFGGISALTRHLYPLLHQSLEPIRVVDLGTGSGEMAALLVRWAAQQHLPIRIGALDRSGRNLSVARDNTHTTPGIFLVQADACALPFADHQVDYFISSLFLHHLSPKQVVDVLSETYHRARHGIVMSDLIRGYLPLLAFRIVQPVFARNYLTYYDGLRSIRRAYTARELLSFAQVAGLEAAHVYCHFPWRMTLVAEKPHV